MFCPQCGANNADNAVVCVQCGRNLQAAPTIPQVAMPGTPIQTPGVVLPPGAGVPNYLVFAILTTVLCCPATGIPAIIYAAKVNEKLQMGDIAGAQQASKNAKLWCLISVGIVVAGFLVWVFLIFVGVLGSMYHPR